MNKASRVTRVINRVDRYRGVLALVFVFLLFGNNSGFQAGLNREASQMYGAPTDVYDATLGAVDIAGAVERTNAEIAQALSTG